VPEDLRVRLKRFALRVINLYVAVKKDDVGRVLGHQVLRSGISVGAHHREAARARSVAEFVSKMEGGLQELDETVYWLDLLAESGRVPPAKLQPLLSEANELMAILVASVNTAKRRRNR
jgi:four helix bundle protein